MATLPHLRLVDGAPSEDGGADVDLDTGPNVTVDEDGVARIEHEDGSVTFDQGGNRSVDSDSKDFFRNLADEIDEEELGRIANDLLTGIQLDIDSRKEWLDTRATGIRMLGLKVEEPSGEMSPSSAPVAGMSSIRHPLLLEATIRFQSTARGELLPASGPVKVRNDQPQRPDQNIAAQPVQPGLPGQPSQPGQPDQMGHNGGPPLQQGDALDDLAAALEKDMNHFLTVTATEYVPDTDRMLFHVGFCGDGFKKVYNHPLKRRPVSETVDAEDLIVSNAATDLRNCGRVTHRIKMRPSEVRRMQIAGFYRDIHLGSPNPFTEQSAPEREKQAIAGVKQQPQQPKDADYEVYECYCELDLANFAPKQFKDKELPLPYVVTLEKQSRKVLAVRRNWDEDDDQCMSKSFFVQFPFIRGLGFYGLGLVHILGNVTMALTALWRIMLDSGMFASFPGFLFAKSAGRQNSNNFRVPAGGGLPVDVPPGMRIQDAFMPLPYKEPSSALMNLGAHIEEVGQRLGQTADLNIGEGKQDVPVGTTMAMIEQATKIMDAVHKRLHAAQAEEFALLKERFREDPEAFWRHNKRPARKWTIEQFKQAINERELVPVADPNNPTSLHRIAKATIVDMLVSKYPLDMDKRNALKRILRIADIDSDGLLLPQSAPPPPDPRMAAITAKAQAEQAKAQIDQARLWLEQQKQQAQLSDSAAERSFKERAQMFELYLEHMRVQAEAIIHAHDIKRDDASTAAEMQQQRAQTVHEIARDHAQHQMDLQHDADKHQQDLLFQQQKLQQQTQMGREKHVQSLVQDAQQHHAALAQQRAAAEAKVDAIKAQVDAKPANDGGKE